MFQRFNQAEFLNTQNFEIACVHSSYLPSGSQKFSCYPYFPHVTGDIHLAVAENIRWQEYAHLGEGLALALNSSLCKGCLHRELFPLHVEWKTLSPSWLFSAFF